MTWSRQRSAPAPHSALLAGAATLVLASVGGAILVARPFGEPPARGELMALAEVLNGFPLALAPAIGLLLLFRPSFSVSVEPYGVWLGRRISRVGWTGVVVMGTLPLAAGLARGDSSLALGIAALVFGSLGLLMESTRRVRGLLPDDAWTDADLDRLRLHLELLPVAVYWLLGVAAMSYALRDEPGGHRSISPSACCGSPFQASIALSCSIRHRGVADCALPP